MSKGSPDQQIKEIVKWMLELPGFLSWYWERPALLDMDLAGRLVDLERGLHRMYARWHLDPPDWLPRAKLEDIPEFDWLKQHRPDLASKFKKEWPGPPYANNFESGLSPEQVIRTRNWGRGLSETSSNEPLSP